MKNRRKAREAILQALYYCDTNGSWSLTDIQFFFAYFHGISASSDDVVSEIQIRNEKNNKIFAEQVVHVVAENLEEIDQHINQASAHWNIDRMSRVDRNILRMGAYELLLLSSVVPLNVTLNEAIEIAKRFGTDESPTFINGILDKIARSLAVNTTPVMMVPKTRSANSK